jgi:hypothetical protein
MTSYVPGGSAALAGQGADTLQTVELRVISNILQGMQGTSQQDELRILRNDQAFELGIVPPVIPGS